MAAADLFDNATLDRARHYLVQCRRNPSLGFVCFTCQRNQLQSRFLRDAWRTAATLTLAQALRTVLCDALAPRADRLHRYAQLSSNHRIRVSFVRPQRDACPHHISLSRGLPLNQRQQFFSFFLRQLHWRCMTTLAHPEMIAKTII